MPHILCDAVTCKFNRGNFNFISFYTLGSFSCACPVVVCVDTTKDCACGVEYNHSFCSSYLPNHSHATNFLSEVLLCQPNQPLSN